MIFHIPEPDGQSKGDARFIFRRKKERLFLRNFLAALIIVVLIGLFGMGFAIKRVHHEIDHHSASFDKFEQGANEKIREVEAIIQDLVDLQKAGERATAGNLFQMFQIYKYGMVDMRTYPRGLRYPDKTWFHEYLQKQGRMIDQVETE